MKLLSRYISYSTVAAVTKSEMERFLGFLKYNLRNCRATLLPNPNTKNYGTDTIPYKAVQLWSMLPTRYKNLSSLDLFKSEIKHWHCSDCPSNICRIFVDGVGFIN